MNSASIEIDAVKVSPAKLVALIKLVEGGSINNNTAKDVLGVMFENGQDADAIVKERGLAQISDSGALEAIIDKVIAANPSEVQSYLGGKEGLFGWLVGQVMKETRGKGNAAMVNEMLKAKLAGMKE